MGNYNKVYSLCKEERCQHEGHKHFVLLATMNCKIWISWLTKLKTKFKYIPKFLELYAIHWYNALFVWQLICKLSHFLDMSNCSDNKTIWQEKEEIWKGKACTAIHIKIHISMAKLGKSFMYLAFLHYFYSPCGGTQLFQRNIFVHSNWTSYSKRRYNATK